MKFGHYNFEIGLLLMYFCDNAGDVTVMCVNCRGLLSRSIMQAQAASPTFTHVYAALVAVINTKVSFQLVVYTDCTVWFLYCFDGLDASLFGHIHIVYFWMCLRVISVRFSSVTGVFLM